MLSPYKLSSGEVKSYFVVNSNQGFFFELLNKVN